MRFHKYQALGNTYTVIEEAANLSPVQVQQLCDVHYGLGSDGLLLLTSAKAPFGLTILNPDGSEAEKSGNGLRIFARYLWDCGWVNGEEFAVQTKGGLVRCQVLDGGARVFVEMGPAKLVGQGVLQLQNQNWAYTAVDLGNPHCVLWVERPTPALAQTLGPHIENATPFPLRTNVQFAEVRSPTAIQLEIWERGAGYTLASGSSACAAAAVAVWQGLCQPNLEVHMPGGVLQIKVSADNSLSLWGPVAKVADGQVYLV